MRRSGFFCSAMAWMAVASMAHADVTAAFEELKPGAVKPQGWILDRAQALRNGYMTHVTEIDPRMARAWTEDFKPRKKDLCWYTPKSDAWGAEGCAYWFEGLVDLAFQLDDSELKDLARRRLEPLLANMHSNAYSTIWWLDRRSPESRQEVINAAHGWMVGAGGAVLRSVLAWSDVSGDRRALDAARWACNVPKFMECGCYAALASSAAEVWRRTDDADVAASVRAFLTGEVKPWQRGMMRWNAPFEQSKDDMLPYVEKRGDVHWQHGVFCNEGLIAAAKGALVLDDAKRLADAVAAWKRLHDIACQPHGVFVGDESYGHPGPRRGTETCDVAGAILANGTFLALTGDGTFGDWAERAFFNAGPRCISRDGRCHLYFQTVNRAGKVAVVGKDPRFPKPTFYLEGNSLYKRTHNPACCTASLTRILPGFVRRMWMLSAEGPVAAYYGPCTAQVETKGVQVTLKETTSYPFDETVSIFVSPARDVDFVLSVRVPGWCAAATCRVDGRDVPLVTKDGFARILRHWPKTGSKVELAFPMRPTVRVLKDLNPDENGAEYAYFTCGPVLMAWSADTSDDNRADEERYLKAAQGVFELGTALGDAKATHGAVPKDFAWGVADAPLRLDVRNAAGEAFGLVPYGCVKTGVSLFPLSRGF